MAYTLLTDKEENFKAMRRLSNQKEEKKHTVVKCTNCGAGIEVLKPEDQYLQCGNCMKRFFLSYSIARSKMYSE
jgi:DNA-directed RNA polymerase subunit RPC12/RpoP